MAPTSTTAGSTAAAALWVHRIIVEPMQVERIVPLAYGTTCELSRGAKCIVGDGFSSATNVEEDHIEAIEDGLFAASQAWVVYDWLVSEASDLLESLDPELSTSEGDVGAAKLTAGAARVAFTARKLTSFMRRQQQGVIDGRGVVYRAAIRTWGLEEELQSLVERADGYVEFVQLQASEMRSRSDRRRNILLFCLSFTAIAQVISGAYELLTGTATAIGPSPRPIIFFVTSAVTLMVLALGLFYAMFVPVRDGPPGRT